MHHVDLHVISKTDFTKHFLQNNSIYCMIARMLLISMFAQFLLHLGAKFTVIVILACLLFFCSKVKTQQEKARMSSFVLSKHSQNTNLNPEMAISLKSILVRFEKLLLHFSSVFQLLKSTEISRSSFDAQLKRLWKDQSFELRIETTSRSFNSSKSKKHLKTLLEKLNFRAVDSIAML